MLAVFHYEADSGVLAESVDPEPEIIGGGRERECLVGIEDVWVEAVGRIENAIAPAKGVDKGRLGIRGVPAPFGERVWIALGVEGDGFDASGVDEGLSVLEPGLVEGAEPVAGIVDIVIGCHNDGLGPFTEGRYEFLEGLEIFTPADFQTEGFQRKQFLRQLFFLPGELGICEPEDEAIGA